MAESDPSTTSFKRRGPESHERLLEAGIDIFGEFGFKAATTRMIAEKAGVNIAAIPYYFSGKEGLYHAVVGHIVEKLRVEAEEALQKIVQHAADKGLSACQALDLLEDFLGRIVDFMVGSPEAPRFVRIILREQLYPSAAYDVIFNRLMNPIVGAITRLIAIAAGIPENRDTGLRAMAFMGQIMAFRVARETVVRRLGLKGYTPEETTQIRRVILEHTRAAVGALANGGL